MNHGKFFKLLVITALGFGSLPGSSQAQTAKDLVGTWRLVSTDNTDATGAKIEPFGPHPLGSFTFDANGHFTQVIVPAEKGPTELVAAFGDYSVTNGGKTLVRHMLGIQDASAIGKDLPIEITLSNDELKTSNVTTTTSARHAISVWHRVK